MKTKLPSGDPDCWAEPINTCKGGVCEIAPLARRTCLLILLCGFPFNAAFLFDFCQVKKLNVFPTAEL